MIPLFLSAHAKLVLGPALNPDARDFVGDPLPELQSVGRGPLTLIGAASPCNDITTGGPDTR